MASFELKFQASGMFSIYMHSFAVMRYGRSPLIIANRRCSVVGFTIHLACYLGLISCSAEANDRKELSKRTNALLVDEYPSMCCSDGTGRVLPILLICDQIFIVSICTRVMQNKVVICLVFALIEIPSSHCLAQGRLGVVNNIDHLLTVLSI